MVNTSTLPSATTLSPEYIREQQSMSYSEQQNAPEEFWDSVEGFLNKPAPSLKAISKKGKKSKKSSSGLLPSIKKKNNPRNSIPTPPDSLSRLKTVKAKVSTNRSGKGNQEKAPLDINLLQEAFAYSSKIKAEAAAESMGKGGVNDAFQDMPGLSRHTYPKTKMKAKIQSQNVKGKKKSSKKSPANGIYGSQKKKGGKKSKGTWDSSDNQDGHNARTMDNKLMSTLVANFTSGSEIENLRKQLSASQNSMNDSRAALQVAAQQFFKR